MLPSAGGVRVAHRAAAINGRPGFCGFPKFAHSLAKSTTLRTFSDKVPASDLTPCSAVSLHSRGRDADRAEGDHPSASQCTISNNSLTE